MSDVGNAITIVKEQTIKTQRVLVYVNDKGDGDMIFGDADDHH